MIRTSTSILLMTLAASVWGETVTLTGEAAHTAMQKTTCGTTEQGVTRYGIFEGRGYSRVPGEKDRHLFDVLGINVRHCSVKTDATRGPGFRSVSREIMVYMDPESGEILDAWTNPWTGKEVKVLHVANDPVNMRAYRYARDEDGEASAEMTLRRYGDVAARSSEVPLFYKNPLGGEYQPYIGGTYHAMEMFNSFYDAARLMDGDEQSIGQSHLAWARVAKWLPWLEMGDRPGVMIFNATGFSTFDQSRIPQRLRRILDDRYPDYWTPPPLDDGRPNETSWTVFKKYMESQKGE
ncbi:MAG: DUF1838 family protein [Xanthomonadales bacterium]|nr:DUF1838 family protein [Xanthomonadales bacterium]